MSKIIVSIVAILLIFFPNNKSLISYNQQITYNSAIGAERIIEAFKNEDVAALEELMCKNIKENTENLSDKIQSMFDIVNGEITETSYEHAGYSFSQSNPGKGEINQSVVRITIKTTVQEYCLFVNWETINTYQPNENGIRRITVNVGDNYAELLCEISATNGICEWHE